MRKALPWAVAVVCLHALYNVRTSCDAGLVAETSSWRAAVRRVVEILAADLRTTRDRG